MIGYPGCVRRRSRRRFSSVRPRTVRHRRKRQRTGTRVGNRSRRPTPECRESRPGMRRPDPGTRGSTSAAALNSTAARNRRHRRHPGDRRRRAPLRSTESRADDIHRRVIETESAAPRHRTSTTPHLATTPRRGGGVPACRRAASHPVTRHGIGGPHRFGGRAPHHPRR